MNNEEFGVLYSIATLLSAFTIPIFGSYIDRYKVRYVSTVNAIFLFLFILLISFTNHWIVLLIGIYGLRLCGQGMMTLIASTAISRFFDAERGKALSLSGLGLSLGEAIMPVVVVSLIGGFDWNIAWRLLGLSILVGFIPLSYIAIRKKDAFQLPEIIEKKKEQSGDQKKRKEVLREKRFYLILFPLIFPAFVLTGLFIHQNLLANNQGWTMEWMATCFVGFGIIKIFTYFLAGPLVDRFTAKRIVPFFLFPLALGLLVLILSTHPYAALLYLLLAGITNAMSAVIGSAVWAELYGVQNLGAIKSIISTFFVAATSVGAILFGWLLNNSESMQYALIASILLMLLASIGASRVLK